MIRGYPIKEFRSIECLQRVIHWKFDQQVEPIRVLVQIRDLIPTQRLLNRALKPQGSDPPILLRAGNQTLILDGHHRLYRLKKAGIERTECLIFELWIDPLLLSHERYRLNLGLSAFADLELSDDC